MGAAGQTWYDALQAKATKRYSSGLEVTVSYAFSKNLDNYRKRTGNIFDRCTLQEPLVRQTGRTS